MRMRVVATFALGVAACGDAVREQDPPARAPSEASPTTRIVTDSTTYVLTRDGPGWKTTIGFTYRAGADTVYIVNCNGAILMHLQKREAGEWSNAWYAEGNACLSPPLVIAPGDVFSGEAEIWGGSAGTPSVNTFRVDEIDGEYRLVWPQPVHRYDENAPAFGDTLPLVDRVSNVFTLRRAQ